MADHVIISQGSGATVATDQVGAVHYQMIKVVDATADSENRWVVDSAGSGQMALKGNVTISDSKGFIGLTTVVQASTARSITGSVTLDPGSKTGIAGNVTISDSKGFIGLTTTTLGASPAFVGIVTVANPSSFTGNVTLDDGSLTGIVGNVTITDSKGFIGLVTVVQGSTVRSVVGNVTVQAVDLDIRDLSAAQDSVAIVGNVTVQAVDLDIRNLSSAQDNVAITGNVTVQAVNLDIRDLSAAQDNVAIIGNVTLSDAKTFIGLVTATPGGYRANSTIFTQVVSANGNTTIFTPPSSQRFFLNNLHVASLGRSEVEVRSGATTLIPFTGLATTGGYFESYGEHGLPGRSVDDAFVINLNGGTTISVMANVRFGV